MAAVAARRAARRTRDAATAAAVAAAVAAAQVEAEDDGDEWGVCVLFSAYGEDGWVAAIRSYAPRADLVRFVCVFGAFVVRFYSV